MTTAAPLPALLDLARAIRAGDASSRALTEGCLARIQIYNPKVNAFITVMRDYAMKQAQELEAEQRAGKFRGPLHGIPIALKDNIHTTDLPTTGGALAFAGYRPPYDATLTQNLRDAGAIIIAKTGLT